MDKPTKEREHYDELACYTLAHSDPAFLHQHAVDAYATQCADENTKPITLVFALVGLYLYVEKNYSGRNVQHVHMLLAKRKRQWPGFSLPEYRGDITVSDVVAAPSGEKRDKMIRKWCEAVWQTYRESHEVIANLVRSELK
jgi:hypothetical protein